MNWEVYQQIHSRISKAPKQPFLTAPKPKFTGDSLDWANIEKIDEAARQAVDKLRAEAARIQADSDLTEEGKSKRLAAFYDREVRSTLKNLRAGLSEFRKRGLSDLEKASATAFDLPEDAYSVALAMKGLDVVRELKAARKLSIADLERLPFSTRQAIAVSPPIYSGVNEHEHAMIRDALLAEAGGVELAGAEAYAQATEDVAAVLAYAEVAAEITAGVTRSHPLAEQGRQMREELEAEGKVPTTEDSGDLIVSTDAN